MKKRWMLSTFFRDAENHRTPTCSAYGGQWIAPVYPEDEDGSGLVLIASTILQTQAAADDPEVVVLPLRGPIGDQVAAVYAGQGAASNMTTEELVALLAGGEPSFDTAEDFIRLG